MFLLLFACSEHGLHSRIPDVELGPLVDTGLAGDDGSADDGFDDGSELDDSSELDEDPEDWPDPELPDEFLDDCPGVWVPWQGTDLVLLGQDPPLQAAVDVPISGLYEVYEPVAAESGPSQTNESAFLRFPNDLNPDGTPELGNCFEDWVVLDPDNAGPPLGTLQYAGTFVLEEGLQPLTVTHFCGRDPRCEALHDPGTTCESGNVNSVHFESGGLCLIPLP